MKAKFLLTFILFCISITNIEAQNSTHIYYTKRMYYKSYGGNNNSMEMDTKLVFNDSLSLFYLMPDGNFMPTFEKDSIIGNILIHHAILYNAKTKSIYEESNHPENKKKFLIEYDTTDRANWKITNETKSILDYNCKLAFKIKNIKDTVFAWYTTDLKYEYGPSFYNGLPGLILQVTDTKLNQYLWVTKILKSNQILVPPLKVKIKKSKYKI